MKSTARPHRYYCAVAEGAWPIWVVYGAALCVPFAVLKKSEEAEKSLKWWVVASRVALAVVGGVVGHVMLHSSSSAWWWALRIAASLCSLDFALGSSSSSSGGVAVDWPWNAVLALVFVVNTATNNHKRLLAVLLLSFGGLAGVRLADSAAADSDRLATLCVLASTLVHVHLLNASTILSAVRRVIDFYCFLWVRPSFANLQLLVSSSSSSLPPPPPLLFQHQQPATSAWQLVYLVLIKHQPREFLISMLHGWAYLTLMSFVDPIALHVLLSSKPGETTTWEFDLSLAVLLSVSMLVRVSCMEICFYYSVRVMAKSRSILQNNLLHHLFPTMGEQQQQRVVLLPTLMSGDAERFGASSWVVFFLASWTFALLSLPVTIWLLSFLVGRGAALLALGIMILGGLVSREIARLAQRGYEALNGKRDVRSRLVLWCLHNMLQIKMFSNEPTWLAKLERARAEEMTVWWRIRLAASFSSSASTLVQVSVPVAVFAYITLVDKHELTAASAFATLLILSQLSWSVGTLPDIFNLYSSLMPCAQRLADHFNEAAAAAVMPDVVPAAATTTNDDDDDDSIIMLQPPCSIGYTRVLFNLPRPIELRRGELTLVTGPAGTGKSCLLLHLAAAFPAVRKMYLGQTPFLFHGTVRENICLGGGGGVDDDDEEPRLQRAVRLAQLDKDLQVLPRGMLTMVGDGGVQLSGGQRARLALARALYFETQVDVFLIDDLTASVDAATGRRIMQDCVCGALTTGGRKAVVMAASHCTREMLEAASVRIDISLTGKCTVERLGGAAVLSTTEDDVADTVPPATTTSSSSEEQDEDSAAPVQRGIRYVDFAEYWSRLNTSCTRWGLVSLVLTQAGLEFASPYWLAHWTSSSSANGGDAAKKVEHGLEIFAAIQVLFVAFGQLVFLCTTLLALQASMSMHSAMLRVLFRSPMSLFDSTSHGKLAQVVLGDLRNLDESLPDSAVSQLKRAVVAVLQIGTITRIAPVVLFMLPVLFVVYRWILNQVRLPSLGVKRMEAQTHGPVLGTFVDAIRGRFTLVHSAGLARRFASIFAQRVAMAEQARVGSEAVSKYAQALAVQSGCMLYLVVSTAGVFALHRGEISDARLGLILTFAGLLQRTGMDLMMGWTSFETNLVSVERVVKLMKGPVEEAEALANGSTNSSSGALAIEFDQVTLRYREGRPLVLRGVTFRIEPGSKVCVVGRTGEGKSSLFLALLRLYSVETGRIRINAEDVTAIPLRRLRRECCRVILQDCRLTERTLRENLVVAEEEELVSDAELWSMLRRVGLFCDGQQQRQLDDEVVSESGADLLSAGERQLVCVARALLQMRPKQQQRVPGLLLCDECTSFLNDELDERVHDELLALKHTTVLAIVHRQPQLHRFDFKLTIEQGQAVAYERL